MAKLGIFGAAMNLARSPFVGTEFERTQFYLRGPVPWDNRKRGVDACTPAQRSRQDALVAASRSASKECPKTGTISTNICRLRAISKSLGGGGRRRAAVPA